MNDMTERELCFLFALCKKERFVFLKQVNNVLASDIANGRKIFLQMPFQVLISACILTCIVYVMAVYSTIYVVFAP